MPSKNPVGTQLVIDGCREWPHLPSRTVARMLVEQNKGVWSSVSVCRNSIMYHRGRTAPARKPGGKKEPCKNVIASSCPSVPHNPWAYLPESDEREFTPFTIDVAKDSLMGVMGDLHIPYHNIPATRTTIAHFKKRTVDVLLINGDLIDFHRLSRFMKDPGARNAAVEIKRTREFLDAIDDAFPKARKIFKFGNHDERYDHYIITQAEEIFHILKEHASLQKLLELEDRGWEWVTEKRPIYAGKLSILHGHEMPAAMIGPVNAARGLFLRTKVSAMVNHHHQVSEHSEPDIRGKLITTWSVGCMCELHPMYARFNRWAHGAAEVELARGGDFRTHNFRIHEGQMMN
jgi:predicted phosphodiesterase